MTKFSRREIRKQRRGMLKKLNEVIKQFGNGVQYSFIYITDGRKGASMTLGELTDLPEEAIAGFIQVVTEEVDKTRKKAP